MSIVISDDNKWLVAGFEAGSVTVWDLMTMNPLKTVASLVADSPTVIKVLFWKGNSDFLSLDSSGNVTLHTIEKYIWTGVRLYKMVIFTWLWRMSISSI
jgi:nicotinate-nucleotide pyrophosphorylase